MDIRFAHNPVYLIADHLDGPVLATVKGVTTEKVFEPNTNTWGNPPVLYYTPSSEVPAGFPTRVVLNRTRQEAMIKIMGGVETDDWKGKEFVLFPSTWKGKKPMVGIRPKRDS